MFKKSNHRAVVTVDINAPNVSQKYDGCSSYTVQQQQLKRQPQQLRTDEPRIDEAAPSEIIQLNLSNNLADPANGSSEDGRINYSATRAQCHGTRHVVNMLGMYNIAMCGVKRGKSLYPLFIQFELN